MFTEYRINEIASLKYGKMPKKDILTESGYPVYSGYRITGFASKYLYEESMVIVVARGVGGTGDVKISPPKAWITNLSIVLDIDKTKVDKYYLVSLLGLESLKDKLNTGSAQSQITINSLNPYKIKLPPLPTQQKIASILSAYDDLIENNNRRIAILEEIARKLYKEWFVKFRFPGHKEVKMVESELGLIPEGWKVVSASETMNINPRTTLTREGEKPYLSMSYLSEDSMIIKGHEYRTGNSGTKFKNGDTLFARITPSLENGKTGYVQFLNDENPIGFGSTEFIVLRSKTLTPEYVYCLARSNSFRDNAIKSMTGATGRQRVQNSCFDTYFFAQPMQNILNQFTGIVRPLFKLIYSLHKKNKNLKQQRDLLLPKLISGKIAVEKQVL